jgi:tetratricopeptide (TPR) repeat protein
MLRINHCPPPERMWPAYAARAGLVVLVLLCVALSSAHASARSRALTRQGYTAAYELNFPESRAIFNEARRIDPADPAPVRALAAVTWMEILFAQGVATFEAFKGDASGDSVQRPAVDHSLTTRFVDVGTAAIQLAEQQVASRPADADAWYQLGASTGLLALYRATVEGRTWAAFVDGRRAVRTMERVRQQQQEHREAALILGMYRYAVSTLSWPKRMLAGAAGMPGDRDGGIALLETAAAVPADTATDASLLLTIIYNREGRYADALRHLRQLRERHPANRLLALNAAAMALAGSDPAGAADTISATLTPLPNFDDPRVLGERAMWYYIRGAARVALGDMHATEDLRHALASDPRDWIRARTHLELAKFALQSGDHAQAKLELEAADRYSRRGADGETIERAKRLWRERRPDGRTHQVGAAGPAGWRIRDRSVGLDLNRGGVAAPAFVALNGVVSRLRWDPAIGRRRTGPMVGPRIHFTTLHNPRVDGTCPSVFALDLARAAVGIQGIATAAPGTLEPIHSFPSAPCPPKTGSVWAYRHTDHHLRRFGL